MITIKNIKNVKPKDVWDVKICRPSPLGNPFVLYNEQDRDAVCDFYEKWFYDTLEISSTYNEIQRLVSLYKTYQKLNLFCCCYPKRCHGETIKKYIRSLI